MKRITDFGKIDHLRRNLSIEKVYPLSVLEGLQKGEIFVDNDEAPNAALIWHYCGFANILGAYDEEFIEETIEMMQDPPEGHSGRMALQTENDGTLEDMILRTPMIVRHERYIFAFAGEKVGREKAGIPPVAGAELKEITAENYDLLKGRIIPAFSWENRDAFLKNGFGYCLIQGRQMMACAFASGVSEQYVDIGVETAEECRGKGYGKAVASAMVKEILRRGKTPQWACDTRNEASMRLACSVGFEITGTHPWYTCEKP